MSTEPNVRTSLTLLPRYYIGPGTKVFSTTVLLPPNLTCAHCVLQWRYVGGEQSQNYINNLLNTCPII